MRKNAVLILQGVKPKLVLMQDELGFKELASDLVAQLVRQVPLLQVHYDLSTVLLSR